MVGKQSREIWRRGLGTGEAGGGGSCSRMRAARGCAIGQRRQRQSSVGMAVGSWRHRYGGWQLRGCEARVATEVNRGKGGSGGLDRYCGSDAGGQPRAARCCGAAVVVAGERAALGSGSRGVSEAGVAAARLLRGVRRGAMVAATGLKRGCSRGGCEAVVAAGNLHSRGQARVTLGCRGQLGGLRCGWCSVVLRSWRTEGCELRGGKTSGPARALQCGWGRQRAALPGW